MRLFFWWIVWLFCWFCLVMNIFVWDLQEWKVYFNYLWRTVEVIKDWELKEMWISEHYQSMSTGWYWLTPVNENWSEKFIYDYSCPDVIGHGECSIKLSEEEILHLLEK